MGKVIQPNYSDINKIILKNSSKKKDRCKKGPRTSNDDLKFSSVSKIKRKLNQQSSLEPPKKITKSEEPPEEHVINNQLAPIIAEEPKELIVYQVKAVRNESENDIRLKILDNDELDLFSLDEARCNYENYTKRDMFFHIVDEITLEGLDGITLEALWKRLSVLLKCSVIPEFIKRFIWYLICNNDKIKFFELPEERGMLNIYDRYKNMNKEMGVFMEIPVDIPDIYKIDAISIISNYEDRGSCSTFHTRVDKTEEIRLMPLKQAFNDYKTKLALVADLSLRINVLYDETSDPNYELSPKEYCILERIGRSRELGELTQGNMSLSNTFNMDAKSLFYYKKHLGQNNFIMKQFFYIKSSLTDQNKTGRLLHLRRFYIKKKPKYLLIAEQVINILKRRPNYRAEYSEIRRIFGMNNFVTKFIKHHEFHKYIKNDLTVPYREIYPNAKKKEYLTKSRAVEKNIKIMELKDPCINVAATWKEDSDSSDSEDENDGVVSGKKAINGECFKQVYRFILSKGITGCTLHDLLAHFNLDSPSLRAIMKKLTARKCVNIKKVDKGRQRHITYIALCLSNTNFVLNAPEPTPQKKPSTAIEELKRKQRERIANVDIREVYTQDQYYLERNLDDADDIQPIINLIVPKITCEFLITCIFDMKISPKETYIKATFLDEKLNFTVDLSFKRFKSNLTHSINEILSQIDENSLLVPKVRANFEKHLSSAYKSDFFTKLFLLKAHFDEIDLQKEEIQNILSENTSRKRKHGAISVASKKVEVKMEDISGEVGETSFVKKDNRLDYMGDNPVILVKETDSDVTVEIMMSTRPEKYITGVTEYKNVTKDLTERVVGRINVILETVNRELIFEDFNKMLKVIGEKEKQEGYDKKIDRKSLARINRKLVTEGYIKILQISMENTRITKTQKFICHPSVDHNHSIIQSALEQMKWKYFVGDAKKAIQPNIAAKKEPSLAYLKKVQSPFREADIIESITELRELNKLKDASIKSKYNRMAGKPYGYKPKFIRMRIIHEFLFYLIYGYNRNSGAKISDAEVIDLFSSYQINLTEEDVQKMPPIYVKEISWKAFIPPLPEHSGWKDGWALVCDIILRMPLSVLVKVHNVAYVLPELAEVLHHPIKRFYLMKNQPEVIRKVVLYNRKYLFAIHENMCRLAYCGLLQFGPEKYKEKDQMFIYLNRKAGLLETISSEPAYHKVTDKEYKKINFYFNSQADLDSYWYNLYHISMNTRLNARNIMAGKTITLVDVSAKPDLVRALSAKTPEEVLEFDNGNIPGDKRGAAGLDSLMWAHIMRNWFWAANPNKSGGEAHLSVMGLKKEKLEKVFPHIFPYEELKIPVSQAATKVYLHKKPEKEKSKPIPKFVKPLPVKTSKSFQKLHRKMNLKVRKGRREYYDHMDKMILKKLGPKVRVQWSEEEDKILLLCRGVCLFLSPQFPKKQHVPYAVVRDVLHRILPNESKNKTSRACQRRMKIHVRDDHLFNNLENNVANLFKLEPIARYYSTLITYITQERDHEGNVFKLAENQLTIAFVILMSYVVPRRKDIELLLQGNMTTVDHFASDNLRYAEENLSELEEEELRHKDVAREDDIKKDVLKSVIHSSLGNRKEHPGWAYQLFKIYQKFPDPVIRTAVSEMKKQQLISIKKFASNATRERSKCHTPFQLSNYYIYSQATTFSRTTASEAFKTFLNLKRNEKNEDFLLFTQEALDNKKYGQMLALNEVASIWLSKMNLKFFVPQNAIILNPFVEDHSDLVEELAVRYQLKLKKMLEDKAEHDSTSKSQKPGHFQQQTIEAMRSQTDPLNLTVSAKIDLTIDSLKSWVTDCMDLTRERSPSPEFITFNEEKHRGEEEAELEEIQIKEEEEEDDDVDMEVGGELNKNTEKKQKKKMLFEIEDIPSVEEIKRGMMEKGERRLVPYITDLNDLLYENFSELNTEESTLEKLKNHFTPQFPYLEDVQFDDLEEFNDFFLIEWISNGLQKRRLWEKIKQEQIIGQPIDMEEVFDLAKKEGGEDGDIILVNELVEFVKNKGCFGATVKELKNEFSHRKTHCSLALLLNILTKGHVFLQVGICTVTFVHNIHQAIWLIETFCLSSDEKRLLEKSNKQNVKEIKDNIDKRLESAQCLRVKILPWTKVDGTLHEDLFKIWLCNILSHCLEFPKISMACLCEKFCHLKPVDIFYLLEVLRKLGCVDLYVFETNETDLFSECEIVKPCSAIILDDFEKMYIEPSNLSMITMGSFFKEDMLLIDE